MRVCFFASDKPREQLLADAFIRGLGPHGDTGEMRDLDGTAQVATGCEVAVMVGVKSREIFEANTKAGIHVVIIDKGYQRQRTGGPVRVWEYWRVAVDGHHPTRYLMHDVRPHDRLEASGLVIAPWRKSGGHILIAGSSAKYHRFYGLREPTDYAARLVGWIRKRTKMPIIYRPKPSWRDAEPIPDTQYSHGKQEPLESVLFDCHALVTHGSNACFEAILSGVPCVILGDGVAKSISSTDIRRVKKPRLATDDERRQWLANLLYHQWTMREFESGKAWAVIRPQIYG